MAFLLLAGLQTYSGLWMCLCLSVYLSIGLTVRPSIWRPLLVKVCYLLFGICFAIRSYWPYRFTCFLLVFILCKNLCFMYQIFLLLADIWLSILAEKRNSAVLSKFVGPVGQSDIFYECPTKNVRVPDQMSDRKYKNIQLVNEKKRNTSDHKGQQWGFMSFRCFCRHSYST